MATASGFGAPRPLTVRATPGHTAGCISLVSKDSSMVFTGDALLVRGTGRTDFQGGDAASMFRSIRDQLFTLPKTSMVYPAHDYDGRTSSTIGEEIRFNPRIGGDAREEDFVGYMRNLGLPHPKQLAVAVPANLRAGQPEDGNAPPVPDWGPVVTTYAGLREISPEWVAHHRHEVQVVDVRTRAEFDGELGHILGAQLIPLDELRERVSEVSGELPVVVVCQTGKRSGMGTVILTKAGLEIRLRTSQAGWSAGGLSASGAESSQTRSREKKRKPRQAVIRPAVARASPARSRSPSAVVVVLQPQSLTLHTFR